MINSIDQVILQHLIHREDYARKVIAFLKEDYFKERTDKVLFNIVKSHLDRYNLPPSMEAVAIDLSNSHELDDDEYKVAKGICDAGKPDEATSLDWMVDQTETFCKDRALTNALMLASEIAFDKKGKISTGMIPEILTQALAVSFDTQLGHDYFESAESQFDWMHSDIARIPFHIDIMNKITRGGLPSNTGWLGLFMAGTNVGKSMTLCDFAANHLMIGKNVLYVTLEMDEHQIVERIDANLLDIVLDDLRFVNRENYLNKKKSLGSKTQGKLIVRKYPGSSTSTVQIRHLLQELKLKKKFIPDIIYIDYLGEMVSCRMKSNDNSYSYMKSIAQEVRGLSDEFCIPILSAVQTNRTGYENSEMSLTHTSESFGIPMVVDLMIGLYTSKELSAMGQMLCFLLKNRLGSKDKYQKFMLGVNMAKQQYHDLEDSAQEGIITGVGEELQKDFESDVLQFH